MKRLIVALMFSLTTTLPNMTVAQDTNDGVNPPDYDLFQGTHNQLQDQYGQGNIGPNDGYDPSQDPPADTSDPGNDIAPPDVPIELPE